MEIQCHIKAEMEDVKMKFKKTYVINFHKHILSSNFGCLSPIHIKKFKHLQICAKENIVTISK